jgi:hypothetical protein
MKSFFCILILFSSVSFAQELNCKVNANYEGLSVNNRELLVNFAGEVEQYMNATQFTGEAWDGEKIDCSLDIFFTGGSSEVDYSAQVVVVSTRPIFNSDRESPMLTINDPTWSFRYVKNQAFYANQSTFEPLTSFLDFYANIIIGFDWETWKDLGGTLFFKKAYDIVNLANSSAYKKGWERNNSSYSRWGLCEDILNDKFRPFREAYYEYHVGGVDYFTVNKPLAQERIVNLINVLNDMKIKTDINSVLIRQFFDSKYGEIIELLRGYSDPSIFVKLKKIDPSHTSKYDEMMP